MYPNSLLYSIGIVEFVFVKNLVHLVHVLHIYKSTSSSMDLKISNITSPNLLLILNLLRIKK